MDGKHKWDITDRVMTVFVYDTRAVNSLEESLFAVVRGISVLELLCGEVDWFFWRADIVNGFVKGNFVFNPFRDEYLNSILKIFQKFQILLFCTANKH